MQWPGQVRVLITEKEEREDVVNKGRNLKHVGLINSTTIYLAIPTYQVE